MIFIGRRIWDGISWRVMHLWKKGTWVKDTITWIDCEELDLGAETHILTILQIYKILIKKA